MVEMGIIFGYQRQCQLNKEIRMEEEKKSKRSLSAIVGQLIAIIVCLCATGILIAATIKLILYIVAL